jgi:hypothetical protein
LSEVINAAGLGGKCPAWALSVTMCAKLLRKPAGDAPALAEILTHLHLPFRDYLRMCLLSGAHKPDIIIIFVFVF